MPLVACRSCRALAAARGLLSDTALDAFARRLPLDQVTAARPAVGFPVRFQSEASELNFMAVLHLLDYGSGYDSLLQQQARHGCQETIQFGLLGMHISGKSFTAKALQELTILDIGNFFAIQTHREEELRPGISISRPGPLKPFADQLLGTLNQTGARLEELGHSDFAELLRPQGTEPAGSVQAGAVVQRLRASLLAFDDSEEVGGSQVLFMRKALALAADLARRFPGGDQAAAGGLGFLPDPQLPGDSGMETVAVLLEAGVLMPPEELAAKLAGQQELSGEEAALLRAGAVAAIARISEASGASQRQVSDYLAQSFRREEGLQLPLVKGSLHV